MKKLTYFSTFSGIGGFELGLESAAKSTGIAVKCVGYSEIDKFADSVYQRHFEGNKNYGDIRKIKAEDLPDFNILVGGFPCQSYSAAGKQKGLKDERGQLFYDLIRIIKAKRPRLILLENVKALLGNDKGRSFATLLSKMAELGLYVEWQVLNSNDFGSPQNRKRLFIIGISGERPSAQVFPLEPLSKTHFNENRIISYSKTLDKVKLKNTVNTILANYKGLGNYNQPGVLDKNGRIRRFTPLECEKLMGFPANWTALGVNRKRISNTQRYHQLGNAVCPMVVKAIFEQIFSIRSLI